MTLPAMSLLWDETRSGWLLIPLLLVILLMLRVVPAAIRRLAPFSDRARTIWVERRQIAKRYDSYQWQKLFWIGVGLALYTVFSHQYLFSRIVVLLACLLSGALGLARWRVVASRTDATGVPENRARDSHEASC